MIRSKTYIIIASILISSLCASTLAQALRNQFIDEHRVTAQKANAEAELLAAKETSESRRYTIEKFSKTLSLWRALRERGEESKALKYIGQLYNDEGFELLKSQHAKLTSADLHTPFFVSKQEDYQSHLDLLQQLHTQHPSDGFAVAAFQFNERARARRLLDLLVKAHVDIRQGVDPQLRYAALTQPASLTLGEIQRLLDPKTLLLEYAFGKKDSYLWAITTDGFHSFTLPKRKQIEGQAHLVYELLIARGKRQSSESAEQRLRRITLADRRFHIESARLSRMILGPIASQLGYQRLLIVADGVLQYIPFAVLPTPTGSRKTGAKLKPLLVNHEIVSLPSATVLATLRREQTRRIQAPKTLAVLADPVFTRDDQRVIRRLIQGRSLPDPPPPAEQPSSTELLARSAKESGVEFDRLIYSRLEAESITALVPASQRMEALDFEANRRTVLDARLEQYRIVHFATHGLLNSAHPELSGLVFSLVDEGGREREGFVQLHDIYNLKLAADLVVLSACQTALGKEVKGEGLVGLTRGLMYAGAARVAASLWEVDDRATAELMKQFYARMLGPEQLRPAAALRAAQIEILKQARWTAPFYWAAFVLQGEWR